MVVETIFGAIFGFEFFPKDLVQYATEIEEAKWGLMISLLFVRITYIHI